MTDVADGPEVVEVDATGNVIEPEAFKRKGRGKVSNETVYATPFSDELLEQAREVGLSESVINDGGDYRQLEKGKIYWLPLQELVEFEVADIETEDDDAFYEWFKAFIDERQLVKKAKKKTKRWDEWKNDDWGWNNQPTSIGKWWSSWGYSTSGDSGSELTRRLAVALKAVTTTVSVVNDTVKRYKVRLAAEDSKDAPVSYTSYDEQLIVVSPQALLDTALSQDEGIEITTGFALHEASHVKYSESLMDALTLPTKLRPQSVAALLHNLLEDMRIEDLTGSKFPGFAEYFVAMNHWMFESTKHLLPTEWGPSLQEKVNAAIMMSKFHADYKPIVDASASLTAEWPWWREWAEAYVANKEPIRQGVIRALEHLAEDEDTKKEMDQLGDDERQIEGRSPKPLTDEQFKQLMEKLKQQLDAGGQTMDPCPSPAGPAPGVPGGKKPDDKGQPVPVTLTAEQAAEVERLIGEQYQQFEAFYKMHDGPSDVAPIIEMSKPIETPESRELYRKPGPLMERLREVFFFRKINPYETERLLKTGFVDEEELWRAGIGDTRLFERTTEPDEHFTSVTMLVDTSGSMVGSGLNKAMELANVMMGCLRTARGVRVRVRAHTTNNMQEAGEIYQTCRMFRIWDPGDPDTRLSLLGTVQHGANFDGFAIDWCAKELNDEAQPNEQKLLIVLSDGLPNGNVMVPGRGRIHYGGGPAMAHMKQMGAYWERQGVTIIQIALDADSIRPEDQAAMFKHWIGYESDRKLLTDLTRLLVKAFGGIE